MTLRRAFPGVLRLLLTLTTILTVGFYGVSASAQRQNSGWQFSELPVFVNRAPRDVRDRALSAMRAAAGQGPAAELARVDLVRLGGAALPHVLPRLDSLDPSERGRVAVALGAVALRMQVADAEEVASPERALLFINRFWQDRSIEFRPPTVRRAVERLAARSLTLRREDVLHADTYALEELIGALGRVATSRDVARVRRLHPVLMHITGRGKPLAATPSLSETRKVVEDWQLFWLAEGADYVVLEGPRRVAALITETQCGKWLAHAFSSELGRALDGSAVAPQLLLALPRSALRVLGLLAAGILLATSLVLLDPSAGLVSRLRARVALASASLVASYPVVLTVVLAFELASDSPGVFRLCVEALRHGDVNLTMGALVALSLLAEVLVSLPRRLSGGVPTSSALGGRAGNSVKTCLK